VPHAVNLAYYTPDATAHAPADYAAQLATLTIPANTVVKTFTVPINDDTIVQKDGFGGKTFLVHMFNSDYTGFIPPASQVGEGFITNDDGVPSEPAWIGGAAVYEGDSTNRAVSATISITILNDDH
jgi:hypothetical protein